MPTLIVAVAVLVPIVLFVVFLVFLVLSQRKLFRPGDTFTATEPLPPGPPVAWAPVPPDPRLVTRFTGGPLAGGMRGFRRVRAAMSARHRGLNAVAFVFTYRNISLMYRPPYVEAYGIVSVDLSRRLPMLQITRTGTPPGDGARFVLGYPPFDSVFQVVTDDERFARAFLVPETVAGLLRDSRAAVLPFRSEGSTLSTWVYDKITGFDDGSALIRPEVVDPAVDFLAEVASHLPG